MTADRAGRVLDGARGWIDRHLEHFDPFKDGELSGLCEIPLTELALLELLDAGGAVTPDEPRRRRRLELLASAQSAAAYRERPFREPETLVSHLLVAAALSAAGRADAPLDAAAIARLVRASTLTVPALPPHRTMELRHALDLCGIAHEMPSYAALFRATLAAHAPNPIFMSNPEAYILTHVVFYATDLGRRAPLGIDARERARLGRLAERLLGMYLAVGNWDLSAELIFTSRCLGTANAFADAGWRCIADAQTPDGGVPGTRWRSGLEPDDDTATRYHTTLVTAIAATAEIAGGAPCS